MERQHVRIPLLEAYGKTLVQPVLGQLLIEAALRRRFRRRSCSLDPAELENYDAFVADWFAKGGRELADAMNAWYQSR